MFGFFYVPFPLIVFIPICKSNFSFHRFYSALCILLIIPSLLIPSSLAFVLLSNFNRNSHFLSFIFFGFYSCSWPTNRNPTFYFWSLSCFIGSVRKRKKNLQKNGLVGNWHACDFIVHCSLFTCRFFWLICFSFMVVISLFPCERSRSFHVIGWVW